MPTGLHVYVHVNVVICTPMVIRVCTLTFDAYVLSPLNKDAIYCLGVVYGYCICRVFLSVTKIISLVDNSFLGTRVEEGFLEKLYTC